MVDSHKENGGTGEVEPPGAEVAKENGSATDTETGSSGLAGALRTYKRRRNTKVAEDRMVSDGSGRRILEKSKKISFDQGSGETSHSPTNLSNDCLFMQRRNIVLQQIFRSLETEDGLKKCMQDALLLHPGSGSTNTVKESVLSCEAGSRCTFQTGSVRDCFQNAVNGSLGITSRGSVDGSNHNSVTELCVSCFFYIIMPEKFAQLCSLLLENGLKVDKLFDLSLINTRMKEKAYEQSPMLFHSDIQQIWTKIQKLGNDIVALAKCLSDRTMSSFSEQHQQAGSSKRCISEDDRHEFPTQESDLHKAEPREACALNEVHTCRRCGEKTDGRNSLVCDSCEEMYHITCIEPAVKEIPVRSWYCANCTEKGAESPHDNCIVCERLHASKPPFDGSGEDELVHEEAPEELEESSNDLVSKGDKIFPLCKACKTEVKNDEDYRICGHSFCPNKFYHVRCLTSKQLKSHGPCWYCPSCLCRACFIDQDDDKIVLCDGCDHAYHIYCMQPPRTSIPRGKWFCTKCDAGLQLIHRAKFSYEKMQNISKNRSLDGKLKIEEALSKSGGVDMLLNAAKTLNYEENMAAMGLRAT